jgi:hypothetical protein
MGREIGGAKFRIKTNTATGRTPEMTIPTPNLRIFTTMLLVGAASFAWSVYNPMVRGY